MNTGLVRTRIGCVEREPAIRDVAARVVGRFGGSFTGLADLGLRMATHRRAPFDAVVLGVGPSPAPAEGRA